MDSTRRDLSFGVRSSIKLIWNYFVLETFCRAVIFPRWPLRKKSSESLESIPFCERAYHPRNVGDLNQLHTHSPITSHKKTTYHHAIAVMCRTQKRTTSNYCTQITVLRKINSQHSNFALCSTPRHAPWNIWDPDLLSAKQKRDSRGTKEDIPNDIFQGTQDEKLDPAQKKTIKLSQEAQNSVSWNSPETRNTKRVSPQKEMETCDGQWTHLVDAATAFSRQKTFITRQHFSALSMMHVVLGSHDVQTKIWPMSLTVSDKICKKFHRRWQKELDHG